MMIVISTFNHESESYQFQCGIYVDKKRCKVVVRSGLFINISYRQSVKLSVNVTYFFKWCSSHPTQVVLLAIQVQW